MVLFFIIALQAFNPHTTCSEIKTLYRTECCGKDNVTIAHTSCPGVVSIVAKGVLKNETNFEANFDALMESVQQESGTLQNEIFRNEKSITFIERYRDVSAVQLHSQNPKVQELLQEITDLNLDILTGARGFGSCPIQTM